MKQLIFGLALALYGFGYSQTTHTIVVKVNYPYLDYDFIDDVNTMKSTLGKILNERGQEQLNRLKNDFPNIEHCTVEKIFPFLQTDDTVSYSRTGRQVTIPPFWAVFNLSFDQNMGYYRFLGALQNEAQLFNYAHPNFKVDWLNTPNDSLYPQQLGYYDGMQSINVEQAWDIDTMAGERFIKVCIHDTGVNAKHEDLDSSVIYGGAYIPGGFGMVDWNIDVEGHGTPIAGIIGARRNNGKGIAGIAGGNGSDSSGVSLISHRLSFFDPPKVGYFCASVVDAARRVDTYYDYDLDLDVMDNYEPFYGTPDYPGWYFNNAPGFGVHVANHSYALVTELPQKEFDKSIPENPGSIDVGTCNVCREAFLFSMQNGVINVVARGNSGTAPSPVDPYWLASYPQRLSEDWHLMVGASGFDGNTVQEGVNQSALDELQGYYSLYGFLDVIAPGSHANVYTTDNDGADTLYGTFNGTSAAAPHVTGAVALILSHYNESCYNRGNLSLEDVAYLLHESATNPEGLPHQYNDVYGWGRLNVGGALEMIENPTKQIVHPDSLISSTVIAVDTIKLRYNQAFVGDHWGPISSGFPLERNHNYLVERVKVENVYDISQYLTPTTTVVDYWARPSVSNAVEYHRDTIIQVDGSTGQPIPYISGDKFQRTPFDSIASVDLVNGTVGVQGYYYHFIGQYVGNNPIQSTLIYDSTQNYDVWLPINPNTDSAYLPFSVYIHDPSLSAHYDYPCDSVNHLYDEWFEEHAALDEFTKNDISVYPNPFSETIKVVFQSNASEKEVILTDVHGKELSKYQPTSEYYILHTDELLAGVYFLNCVVDGIPTTFKLIRK